MICILRVFLKNTSPAIKGQVLLYQTLCLNHSWLVVAARATKVVRRTINIWGRGLDQRSFSALNI